MIELLKHLISFNVGLDTIAINIKWMLLWPIVVVSLYVHYRAVKSFIK